MGATARSSWDFLTLRGLVFSPSSSTTPSSQQTTSPMLLLRLLLLLLSHFSRVRLCATPETAAHQAPWGSPGKNTGVGCHCLLQCMKVKSESEVAQLCPTFPNPMDCSLPGSYVHGIFEARVLEWGAVAFSEETYLHIVNST